MKKKVSVIIGSPRKRKNCDFIVDTVIRGLEENNDVEVKKYYLKDMKIGHCIACGYCEKTGTCFQKDDGEPLYRVYDESDGIILAAPIYMDALNSITKTAIDRLQAFWSSKYILKKPSIDVNKKRHGALILVGGSPSGVCRFDGALLSTKFFFKSVNTEEKFRLLVDNTDEIPANERKDVIEEAYNIGKNFFVGFDE